MKRLILLTALLTLTATPAHATVLPTFTPKLTTQFHKDLQRADRAGMRPRVFAKVGDSNTSTFYAFYGLGCRKARLDGRHHLARVIARYRAVTLPEGWVPGALMPAPEDCQPTNSFSRYSAATRAGGKTTLFSETPVSELGPGSFFQADPACRPEETLLVCEIRQLRPRYTLIALGSNDQANSEPIEGAFGRFAGLVRQTRQHRSVPVLLTVPPHLGDSGQWEYARRTSAAIRAVGRRLRVPVLDVWSALSSPRMVNYGLVREDGLHLETFGGFRSRGALVRSIDFRRPALRFGANRRNLLVLQLLWVLDRHANKKAPRR